MVNRIPPHDIDAEEWVLGALLIDGQSISSVCNSLKDGDFYSERNGFVYSVCLDLYKDENR
jgi:replicative DNA helicase